MATQRSTPVTVKQADGSHRLDGTSEYAIFTRRKSIYGGMEWTAQLHWTDTGKASRWGGIWGTLAQAKKETIWLMGARGTL